jgi:hypothetical protein
MFPSSPSKKRPQRQRAVRAHAEPAGGFVFRSIVGTIFIFGGSFLLLNVLRSGQVSEARAQGVSRAAFGDEAHLDSCLQISSPSGHTQSSIR